VEWLKVKALSSHPSTVKKKKEREIGRKEGRKRGRKGGRKENIYNDLKRPSGSSFLSS
jgi:hypothetical protein